MTFFLASCSLLVAAVAVGWLVGVRKHLSELGMRVLESEDVSRIIEAANKTAFFESRVAACEDGTKQSQKQLAEHGTKLGELATNLGATQNLAKGSETGLADASEKMASLESRMATCEDRTEQDENRLSELEKRANELATKLEAAEKMLNEHAAGIAETDRSMKVAADAIESLEEFQTVTERARNLILGTLNDMQASVPNNEECPGGVGVDTTGSVEISQGSEEGQAEDESQTDPRTISSEIAANHAVQETGSSLGDLGTT